MSDWWSRRLGGDPPPPRQPSTPPTQTPQWQPQPAGPPPADWAGAGGAGAVPVDPNAVYQVRIGDALSGAAPVHTDGDKAQKDVREGRIDQQCPECGSLNYFSRAWTESGTLIRGPQPAPHCNDCGFPIVQAGSSRGTLAGAKAGGPAKHSHQPTLRDPAAYGT